MAETNVEKKVMAYKVGDSVRIRASIPSAAELEAATVGWYPQLMDALLGREGVVRKAQRDACLVALGDDGRNLWWFMHAWLEPASEALAEGSIIRSPVGEVCRLLFANASGGWTLADAAGRQCVVASLEGWTQTEGKFLIGDQVVVQDKPAANEGNPPVWVPEMDALCGKALTVRGPGMNGSLDAGNFFWKPQWLRHACAVLPPLAAGDRVRVTQNRPQNLPGLLTWFSKMDCYLGTEQVVERTNASYNIRLFGNDHFFRREWLEKLPPAEVPAVAPAVASAVASAVAPAVAPAPIPGFSPGTRVRITAERPEKDDKSGNSVWIDAIQPYLGKQATVQRTAANGLVYLEGCGWPFRPEWLTSDLATHVADLERRLAELERRLAKLRDL